MRHPSPLRAELVALMAVAAGVLLRVALEPILGGTQAWLTFWPAVFAAGWFGGRRAGLEATMLSLVCVIGWQVTHPVLTAERLALGAIVFSGCGAAFAFVVELSRRSRIEEVRSRKIAEAAESDERKQRESALAFANALSAAGSPEEVANVLVEYGTRALGADVGAVARFEGTMLEVVAVRGVKGVGMGARFPIAGGAPLAVALRERAARFVETEKEFRELFPEVANIDEAHGAAVAMPLETDEHAIGAVAFRFVAERTFSEDERNLVRTLVAQTAQAFHRAELFEAEQRSNLRRHALNELSTVLAAAESIEDVSQTIVTEAKRAAGADTAVLYVVEGDRLHLVAERGGAPDVVAQVRDIPLDSDYARSLATARWIEAQEQYEQEVPAMASMPSIHRRPVAFWSAPLTAGGRMIGILAMGYFEPRKFSDDEREFVNLFARHCAQAVARAERAKAAGAADRAKDEFLAMLGHELRNPLAPITTALELIDMGGDAMRAHGIIRRQVEHLTHMVDDLLDVSRITAGKVQITKRKERLHDVVARAIEMVSPLFEERRHRLAVDVPAHLLVDVDATRMSQVLGNILTNAAKYTDAHGDVKIAARADGPEVVIDVTDTGVGIEPALLANIFELFTQAPQSFERSRGGLGLGLGIARMLVDQHGGTLTAHSDGLGKGSRFSIRIPRSLDSQPELPVAPDVPAANAPQKRVLVVDDNRDAADMLAALAEHRGHMTRNAGDGPDALRILQDFTPDVALLDLGLPVMDGYELAQRIREIPRLSTIRLVAVTGYGQPSDRERARAAGFDVHLVKPVQLEDVLRAIED